MLRTRIGAALIVGLAALSVSSCTEESRPGGRAGLGIAGGQTPFADNNGTTPTGYTGPLFQLSHAYPASVPPPPAPAPWRAAIGNGAITPQNAGAYVTALKNYVAPQMRKLLLDYPNWNAAAEGWYNEPWLGAEREPIHGMYVGTEAFPTSQFPGTNLKAPFSTYVLTYYDSRAANTLYKVWGTDAVDPSVTPTSTQFADGSVVVKAAFTTANSDVWPPMQGALQWPAYITVNATTGNHPKPQIDQLSFLQFDIIVKDTASAPNTGWVFSTLVYDKDAPGNDAWDKMVPLGAMWGNDPAVNSALPNPPPLQETWINPAAPAYAKTTLGWGGRLSGPNDGALNDAVLRQNPVLQGKAVPNLASSSCMGCHIAAQWPMQSFLLPTPTNPPQNPYGDYLVMWTPGSPEWMRWFQSPPGNKPMDTGSTAFDYDMVFAFKSLPQWQAAVLPQSRDARINRKGQVPVLGESYNGRPFRSPDIGLRARR
jgi:hypothetical protein